MKKCILFLILSITSLAKAGDIIDLSPHYADTTLILSYPVSREKYMAQPSWTAGSANIPLAQEAACTSALEWIKKKYPDLTLWIHQVDLKGDLFEKGKWHYEISFRGFQRPLVFGDDITKVVILFDGTIVEPVKAKPRK